MVRLQSTLFGQFLSLLKLWRCVRFLQLILVLPNGWRVVLRLLGIPALDVEGRPPVAGPTTAHGVGRMEAELRLDLPAGVVELPLLSLEQIRSRGGEPFNLYQLPEAVLKFRREGTGVEVVGLNEASATIVDRFALHDKPGVVDNLMGH